VTSTDSIEGAASAPAGEKRQVIPLAEERLSVSRRGIETGRVQVRVRTETEEVRVRETLRADAVEVDRVPVGRELAPGEAVPTPREEEDGAVLVIPVLEEVLVVERRLVLREEVRVRRTTAAEPVEQPVTLRRQRAEVERLPPSTPAGAAAPHPAEPTR
jgi:stress response protein YsnF